MSLNIKSFGDKSLGTKGIFIHVVQIKEFVTECLGWSKLMVYIDSIYQGMIDFLSDNPHLQGRQADVTAAIAVIKIVWNLVRVCVSCLSLWLCLTSFF